MGHNMDAKLYLHCTVEIGYFLTCLFVEVPDEGPKVGVGCAQPRALLTFSCHYCLCKTTKSHLQIAEGVIWEYLSLRGGVGHRQHEQDQPWRITRLGAIPAFHWLPVLLALFLLVESNYSPHLIGSTFLNSQCLLVLHNLNEAVLRQASQCLKIFQSRKKPSKPKSNLFTQCKCHVHQTLCFTSNGCAWF